MHKEMNYTAIFKEKQTWSLLTSFTFICFSAIFVLRSKESRSPAEVILKMLGNVSFLTFQIKVLYIVVTASTEFKIRSVKDLDFKGTEFIK